MKRIKVILSFMAMCLAFVTTGITGEVSKAAAQQVQVADSGLINAVKDTITQATGQKTYTKVVKGLKSVVVLSVDVVKIGGAVNGTVKWYRSIGGGWALVETDTITDGTATYDFVRAPGDGLAYRAVVDVSGTQSASYQFRYMWK